jgi:SAM-dependent methyltransferase
MWQSGDAYENYMGRWSRRVAKEFIDWLVPPASWNWLELGCGTGALTEAISLHTHPASVVACDPSAEFVAYARHTLTGSEITFVVAGVDDLPRREGGFDCVVSGLVLNFLPDPEKAVQSMCSRLRPQGMIAAYVWDYAEGMPFLYAFWEEAIALDTRAAALNQRELFPLCHPRVLVNLFEQAGLEQVESHGLEISMPFDDFDSYWTPFLGGTGPAPSYVSSLDPAAREQLRLRLRQRLTPSEDRPFQLSARAWAVRGYLG